VPDSRAQPNCPPDLSPATLARARRDGEFNTCGRVCTYERPGLRTYPEMRAWDGKEESRPASPLESPSGSATGRRSRRSPGLDLVEALGGGHNYLIP
jgi:hypothetical protein